MIICRTVLELRNLLQSIKGKLGFVPTMGFLHEGHRSLMEKAKAECDITVLSIFVNPLQFGPSEDLDRYPRDEERDHRIAKLAGIDIIFQPSVEEVYPRPAQLPIHVNEDLSGKLCGRSRFGHFDGVATVVLKFLLIVQPDIVYFGQKDAQQVAVIEQLVKEYFLTVAVQSCPTVRESDGLAMSSRNVYLDEEERLQAPVLYHTLCITAEKWRCGLLNAITAKSVMIEKIEQVAKVDYVEVLAYPSLQEISRARIEDHSILFAGAIYLGQTRLIDNMMIPWKTGDIKSSGGEQGCIEQ